MSGCGKINKCSVSLLNFKKGDWKISESKDFEFKKLCKGSVENFDVKFSANFGIMLAVYETKEAKTKDGLYLSLEISRYKPYNVRFFMRPWKML